MSGSRGRVLVERPLVEELVALGLPLVVGGKLLGIPKRILGEQVDAVDAHWAWQREEGLVEAFLLRLGTRAHAGQHRVAPRLLEAVAGDFIREEAVLVLQLRVGVDGILVGVDDALVDEGVVVGHGMVLGLFDRRVLESLHRLAPEGLAQHDLRERVLPLCRLGNECAKAVGEPLRVGQRSLGGALFAGKQRAPIPHEHLASGGGELGELLGAELSLQVIVRQLLGTVAPRRVVVLLDVPTVLCHGLVRIDAIAREDGRANVLVVLEDALRRLHANGLLVELVLGR